jgi:hypothetical protein
VRSIPLWLTQKLQIPSIIRQETGYKGPILFVEHHLAHAASTFFVSPFDEAAILTVDGGRMVTTTVAGGGSPIKILLLLSRHVTWLGVRREGEVDGPGAAMASLLARSDDPRQARGSFQPRICITMGPRC